MFLKYFQFFLISTGNPGIVVYSPNIFQFFLISTIIINQYLLSSRLSVLPYFNEECGVGAILSACFQFFLISTRRKRVEKPGCKHLSVLPYFNLVFLLHLERVLATLSVLPYFNSLPLYLCLSLLAFSSSLFQHVTFLALFFRFYFQFFLISTYGLKVLEELEREAFSSSLFQHIHKHKTSPTFSLSVLPYFNRKAYKRNVKKVILSVLPYFNILYILGILIPLFFQFFLISTVPHLQRLRNT